MGSGSLEHTGTAHEKRAVALGSVAAAVVITALKILVGLSTASLGILSEAAHSGLDLIAALVTFFSVRVSDRPADANHQYGHGKVENFSAFIETGLLILATFWILYEAIQRLAFPGAPTIEPTAVAFAVMFLSIAVDAWRSRALRRIAEKYDSQALEADALHFRTDVWSSSVVIVGLGLVKLAHVTGRVWLAKADAVAALFVAGVILYVSSRLARQTIDALLDAVHPGVRAQVTQAVLQVEGVLGVERARIRRAGNRYFADIVIALARNLTFQRSEQLSEAVTAAVNRVLPDCDVVVHSVARATRAESIFDRVRAVAASNNLTVHDVSVQDLHGRIHVEQHLELNEQLSLKDAHDHASRLEAEIREAVPEITTILTHIESEPATIETGEEIAALSDLERRFRNIALAMPGIVDVHDLSFRRVGDKLYLSCHVTMPDDLPLSRVHDLQTQLEGRFKQAAPRVFRVLIHPEPSTDNRR
ncbi:MAG TPA: cation-efflux pump [Terriglobales bacterium]|nr:cation-efflux pump [Terriglobales bacterium]